MMGADGILSRQSYSLDKSRKLLPKTLRGVLVMPVGSVGLSQIA